MWQGLEETDAEIYAVVWETKVHRAPACSYGSNLASTVDLQSLVIYTRPACV